MKLKLLTAAVSLAAGLSAQAANVQLYGQVDTGIAYTHHKVDGETFSQTQMVSSAQEATFFGLKGQETVSDGLNVGFVLISGFESDTGSLGFNGRFFGNRSFLYVDSRDYGRISMGRLLSTDTQLSSCMLPYRGVSGAPFGSWRFITASTPGRMDNTVEYKTPEFAGWQLQAQYSFNPNVLDNNTKSFAEGSSGTDRAWNVGIRNQTGPLAVAMIVDGMNYSKVYRHAAGLTHTTDGYAVTLGGSYDFGPVKVYAMTTAFKHMKNVQPKFLGQLNVFALDGYTAILSASGKLGKGELKGMAGLEDAELSYTEEKVKRELAMVTYSYPLSKRTSVYSTLAYAKQSSETTRAPMMSDAEVYGVQCGITHRF